MASSLNIETPSLFMSSNIGYPSPAVRSTQTSSYSSSLNELEDSLYTIGDEIRESAPGGRFTFLQENFGENETPAAVTINNTGFLDDTPLINPQIKEEEYYMAESVYSEYDNSSENVNNENENVGVEPFAGLGLNGVSNSTDTPQTEAKPAASPIMLTSNSPVKAIRTSAIINGKPSPNLLKEQNYISNDISNVDISDLTAKLLSENCNDYSKYSIISGETPRGLPSSPNKFADTNKKFQDESVPDSQEGTSGTSDSDSTDWNAKEKPTTEVSRKSQSSVLNEDRSSDSSSIHRRTTLKRNTELQLDDENFAYLFIIAVHSFDARTLDNPDDTAICLSFEKNDVAFVHTVDESGWGEVTLVRNRNRGWVPFNYFSDTVKCDTSKNSVVSDNNFEYLISSRAPMQTLLSASAMFLLHPQDTPMPGSDKLTFDINHINVVKDGVKKVLEMTDCVSRSDELVRQRPLIRRARKQLLADWYNLMIKADYYKHSTDSENINTLTILLYEVLNQAFSFFEVWAAEKTDFEKEKASDLDHEICLKTSERPAYMRNTPLCYLEEPPLATKRLQEVYDLLFLYVGLILGRMDLIERNSSGSEMLEAIAHQMIILLRELLYISKACSSIIQDRFQYAYDDTLHRNLDPLLSLVSELVSCVKLMVLQILHENASSENMQLLVREESYHHTEQGRRLLSIVSKMATLISHTVSGCNSYLRLIGDFQLGKDKKYLDLHKMRITPSNFISHCARSLKKDFDENELNKAIQEQPPESSLFPTHRNVNRFSTIIAGNEKELGLTIEGGHFLQEIFQERKPFDRDSKFAPFRLEDGEHEFDGSMDDINNREAMHKQLMFNKEGVLIGASFKALVYKLTDEIERPGDFFIAAFLLNFRSFGNTTDLIEALMTRFDFSDESMRYESHEKNGQYSSRASRMKNRRKLVCNVFQLWLKSYWNYSTDHHYLPTLINFFNECLSVFLPLDAKIFLETAAKLSTFAPFSMESKKRPRSQHQLQPTSLHESKSCSIYSDVSSPSKGSNRSSGSCGHQLLEDYELGRIPNHSRNSMSLPLPVLNYGTSSLLSKRNIEDMQRLLISYRLVTGYSTPDSTNDFRPEVDTRFLIAEWNDLVSNKPEVSQSLAHNDMNLIDINALELAKQLTLIESHLFLAVEPFELLDENYLPKRYHLGLAPNVNAILNFTNQLSDYVIECILYPRLPLMDRVSRLRGWLRVALATLYFRNFNSLAAIMTALQNHALTRLHDIWDGLNEKETDLYEYLTRVVHPNNNFKVYRKKLKRYIERRQSGDRKSSKSLVPVVPFFNLFLQDLTFINEGNSETRGNVGFRPHTLINIDKYFKITKTLDIINYFQVDYETNPQETDILGSFWNIGDHLDQDTKNIKPVPLVQEFILYEFWRVNTLFSANKDRGYQLSLSLRPAALPR